jgi:hypothetical protein
MCLEILHFHYYFYLPVGRDSSVSIASGYGLDNSGIESLGGGGRARFSARIQAGPGAHSSLLQGVKVAW